jgi:hypothetical protein
VWEFRGDAVAVVFVARGVDVTDSDRKLHDGVTSKYPSNVQCTCIFYVMPLAP